MPIDTAIQDVLLFGADRTGRKDSSRAFQKSVDALARLGGGVVRLPAGRYLLGSPIDLRGIWGIQFQGVSGGAGAQGGVVETRGSQVILPTSGYNGFELDQSKGIGFRDIQFRRPSQLRTDPGDAIHAINQTSDCRVVDCYFTNFAHGVNFLDSWQNYFRGCGFLYCNIGAKVDLTPGSGQSNDTKFLGCILGQCEENELYINANTVYVAGCDFESAVSAVGIYIKYGQECVIAGCSTIHGIFAIDFDRSRITGCHIRADATDGIRCFRNKELIISNNVISGAKDHGIRLEQTSDSLVQGNQILQSGSGGSPFARGVLVKEASLRNSIQGNTVRRKGKSYDHAVQVADSSSMGNWIANNDLRDGSSGAAIVTDPGSNSIVNGNLI